MENIAALEQTAFKEVEAAESSAALRELEVRYLGRSGQYTALLRGLGSMSADDKPKFGKALNDAKARLQNAIDEKSVILSQLEQTRLATAEAKAARSRMISSIVRRPTIERSAPARTSRVNSSISSC